jgi:hypothetical protein
MPTAQGLEVRKVPDKSQGQRIVRFHPETGERMLVNPDTPGEDHEPWPLLGVEINDAKRAMLSQSYVATARQEGWMEATGEKIVHKPGGPPSNPWGVTHTFVHLDTITIKTMDGDVKFKVTRNPDKYDVGPINLGAEAKKLTKTALSGKPTDSPADPDTTVDWFYLLERTDG